MRAIIGTHVIDAMPIPYGINAYFTPNHHSCKGIRPNQIRNPSQTILAVELFENTVIDHFMTMCWGDPPDVANSMMQERQWDSLDTT